MGKKKRPIIIPLPNKMWLCYCNPSKHKRSPASRMQHGFGWTHLISPANYCFEWILYHSLRLKFWGLYLWSYICSMWRSVESFLFSFFLSVPFPLEVLLLMKITHLKECWAQSMGCFLHFLQSNKGKSCKTWIAVHSLQRGLLDFTEIKE